MERAGGVVHTRRSKEVEDKVYVAVDEEQGWSTLLWALQNLANKGTTIMIAHVYCPAQTIPVMGEEVHHTMVNSEVVDAYRKMERAKAEVKLDEYVQICTRQKFPCWKVTIEKDDVAKGLKELIALHGITKLVMGAAADECYSNALLSWNLNWSKTAYRLVTEADKSCKIWFTCKGHLICTRYIQKQTKLPTSPLIIDREGDRKTFLTPLPIGDGVCEAQLFGEKIYEESTGRQKDERDMFCALQMIGEWKMLHQHEIWRRQAIEESYLRDRQEVKEMIQRFEAIYDQLDDARELKQRVTEMESARKYHKEELAMSKYSLEMLKADKEKLQIELDWCMTEMESARKYQKDELVMSKYSLEMLKADKEHLQLELDRCMTEMDSTRKYHKEEIAMSNSSLEMLKVDKEKLQLDLDRCMIEMESARKYHREEMARSRYIIETLQADKKRLQQQLDAALVERNL